MKILTLLNGEECMVDDDDYAELSKYTWYTITTQNNVYAQRTEWLRESKTCKYVLMHRQILGIGTLFMR